MQCRLFIPLMAALLVSAPSFASYSGHGGGHGHCSSHAHIHSHLMASSAHYHYHPAYHHRSGDHYFAGNTGNRYNHSPLYRNPLLGEHEVSIGLGSAADNQLQDSAATFASPTAFFTYRYYISNGVSLGITGGMQTLKGASIYTNDLGQGMPFSYTQQDFTVAAEATFLYSSRGWFQAYGMLGLGVLHWTEYDADRNGADFTESGNKLAWQVTPLGFRVGRSLGVFAELGYGYKGVVYGGLSYQAGWRKTHPYYNPQHF